MRKLTTYIVTALTPLLFVGCSEANKSLADFSTITDTVKAGLSTVKEHAPKDDYDIGVKIANSIVTQKIYKTSHPRVIYLNSILQTLKRYSKKPYLYDDYKLVLVEDKSFNAYALPGGIIVMHDGVFGQTFNEDQMASIIAHEIGHIENSHFLKDAKVEDMHKLASFGMQKATKGDNNAMLNSLLTNMKGQILNGYSVEQEAEADQTSINLLASAGYETRALGEVLENLKKKSNSYGGANYPKDRIALLEKNELYTSEYQNVNNKKIRERRFDQQKYMRY